MLENKLYSSLWWN